MAPSKSKSGKKWTRGPRIGKGVYATMFLATNTENGKKFAVKSADKSNLTQRLALEVERKLLKECKSQYVVKYLGCDTTDRVKEMGGQNTFNLLIELVPRGSILDHIHRNDDALPEEIVAAYTRDILRALSYLHSRGIVHGDVKAENCLIGRENIKLCDLGSGKFLADGDFPLEPRVGREHLKRIFTTGTPGWKAPEVLDETEQGPASDTYSLGCTVVEMCTGRPPGVVPTVYQSSTQVHPDTGLPVVSVDVPPNYSHLCRDFVELCLKPDPRERHDVDELLRHVWFSKPCVYPVDKQPRTTIRPQQGYKQSSPHHQTPRSPHPPTASVSTGCGNICGCES